MNELTKNLQSFNSKERFFLIGNILGNSEFKLSLEFRKKLNDMFDFKISTNVFSAMDYHLDWLYAGLQITGNDKDKIYSNKERMIKATQEDIDYMIVSEINNQTHIMLIEAKGVTGWNNKQMDSKALRLKEIFGEEGNKWPEVIPHFLIMSPKQPERLNLREWPRWMAPLGKVKWLRLSVPEYLNKVTRCNQDGKAYINGKYWTMKSR